MATKNAPLPLIVGNWKMNGLHNDAMERVNTIAELHMDMGSRPVDVAVCPPTSLVSEVAAFLSPTQVRVGAQDVSPFPNGPHTGDVSAEMLRNAGCACCIVGHSERRHGHGETDELVLSKAEAVLEKELAAIICIGETQEERDGGKTLEVLSRQLKKSVPERSNSVKTVIAYEPVWAIGTGVTPTMEQIEEAHGHIRQDLYERFDYDGYAFRILYGGSVTPENCKDILLVDHVNGALVGGASLDPDKFWPIVLAAPIPESAIIGSKIA